jgi:serine protease
VRVPRYAWAAVGCLISLSAAPTAAQLSTPERSGAAPALPATQYRDGASWVVVERAAAAQGPLRPAILRSGTHGFHARLSARAIVQVSPGVAPERIWQREGLHAVRTLSDALHMYLVEGRSHEDGADIAGRLAQRSDVDSAVPDLHLARARHGIAIPPNDPHYAGQWYLRKLAIERAWRLSTGDRDTSVVIIDDGCDTQHPDLQANFQGGLDLVDMDDDPSVAPGQPGNAHGTQCAGLVAAQANNGIGIAGVCPECSLRCVRLLRDDDQGVAISADIMAFDYALTVGASVVSNSWGFAEATPVPAPLRSIIARLYTQGRGGRGTLVVFSAGNENRELAEDELDAINGVLTVGAVNNFDESAPFSNHGASLDLAAPTGTLTTDVSGSDGDDPGDYTNLFGGTSSACPIVAGAAALVMSARPELSAAEVSDLLIASARHAPYAVPDADGHDPVYGFGIVDPGAALRSTLGVTEPDPPTAGTNADAGVGTSATKSDAGCSVRLMRAGPATGWVGLGCLTVGTIARRRRALAHRTRAAAAH